MTHGMALLVHSLRRFRPLLALTGLILAAFQVLFCFAAVALAQSDSIGTLAAIIPAPIREALGPGLVTMVSFSGIACLGYFHIALIGVLAGVITAVATEPAAEMESRFIDLILSHPLPRYWIVLRSFLLVAFATLALVGSMSLGSILGILWLAPEYREMLGTIKLLAINLGALMLAWGSIALVLASCARRRAMPATAAGILVMTTYITDYLGRIWEPARRVSWLSPFHYYDPVGIIASVALPESNLWILAGTAAASTLTALAIFSRRDI